MPVYLYFVVVVATFVWAAPFPLFRLKSKHSAVAVDVRARWGVALQCVGYTLLWQGQFWLRTPAMWQVVASVILFSAASLLSWTAARVLGTQLRVDARLDAEHELAQGGPYRSVRHPIYTSMFCVVLATGVLLTPIPLFVAAVVVFLAGTEIRMRVEEGLLVARFGEKYVAYKVAVPRFIPFLR
jgi:protein-S-isoprenylcysteine O-methyltransferase Ste14